MLDFLKAIKLDNWWTVMIFIGIALFIAGITMDFNFVAGKYISGLGIGIFIIGMTYLAAQKHVNIFAAGGMFKTKSSLLSTTHKIFLSIGWLITAFFGLLILWDLI